MPQTIFIVGCGYLGRVAAKKWLAAGHRVLALTRSKSAELESLGITPIIGDVTQPDTLTFPPVDGVLYAVGMDRTAGKSMREVYLDGLTHVLNRLPQTGWFTYVSSTSVYGQATGEWVNEASPTEPIEENGQLLVECEQRLRQLRPNALLLRFAGIYGPNRVIRRAAIERGEPLMADPEKWLNLIHVDDGADIIIQTAGASGLYNVSDGHPITRRDFYTTMAQLLNAPPAQFQPPIAGTSIGTHDRTDRRISNQRLVEQFKIHFKYPNAQAGLLASINPPSG